MRPKVSIVVITYNHEKFISKALDSFIMQKTDFKFEVIVAEDCSTDKTREIICEYSKRYPDIIKPVLRNKNIGVYENFMDACERVNGQYVIINDGDDYFSDSEKLQKQVEFLDANMDYSICFHPVTIMWTDKSHVDMVFPAWDKVRKLKLDIYELLEENYIQTNSCMYRWEFTNKNIRDFVPEIVPGDWYLHLLHAKVGKIAFLPEVMSVYRRHPGGIWWSTVTDIDQFHLKNGIKLLNFYSNVYRNIVNKSDCYLDRLTSEFNKIMNVYYENGCFDKLVEIKNQFYDEVQLSLRNKNHEEYKNYKRYKKYRKLFKILLLTSICSIILNIFILYK